MARTAASARDAALIGAIFAASLLASASAGGCLRCHEDWHVYSARRGYGGGRYFWLDTAATPAADIGFFNDPSTGWRAVNEANIRQGNSNFWIGAWTPTTPAVHQRLPELLLRFRRQTDAAADAGTFVIRASTTTTTPSATGMCAGAYAGAYFVNEKWGLINSFSHLSTRVASYNPATGTISSGVGLVFNVRVTSAGFSGYTAILRNRGPGGSPAEICAGIYKTVNGANVALTNQVFTDVTRLPNATNLLNPTVLTTPLSSRTFARIGVTKNGGTMSLWFDNPTNVVLTVTDPSPLPPGHVGVAGIGVNGAVFDDVVLADSPTCSDGIHNGGETGVDCGGVSDTVCPPCAAVDTYSHNFGTEGLVGWQHESHGTASNAHTPTLAATSISFSQNTGLWFPGSFGLNSRGWLAGWIYLAIKWPASVDCEVTWTTTPTDNDWLGMVVRYVDSDNFIFFNARQEATSEQTPFTIQRRRNGVNTVLYAQDAQLPDPYTPTSLTTFTFRAVGNTFTVLNGARVVGTAIDPDPMYAPGLVGFIGGNQAGIIINSYTYRITRNAPVAPIQPPGLSLSAPGVAALTLHVEAPSLPSFPLGTLSIWKGLSSSGFSLAHSPFIWPAASQPGTTPSVSAVGNAVSFAGSHFLAATTTVLGEPGVAGFAFVITVAPTATVAAGAAGVIAAKGLRDRPYLPMASGWRLQFTTSRAVSGSPAGTLAVQFVAQSAEGSNGPAVDRVADLATAAPALNTPAVIAVRVSPSTVATGPLDSRTFSVTALINNVSFTDSADNTLTGIISSSIDSMLSVGATDVQTDGAFAGILELQVFSEAVSDADFFASVNYQMARYIIAPSTCPDFNVTDAVPAAGSCAAGSPEGSTCTVACANGATLTSGSPTVTCSRGRWLGRIPRCEFVCPPLSAPGTGGSNGCRSVVFQETWPAAGTAVGPFSGPTYAHWLVTPASGGNIRTSPAGGLATVTPPFGFRFGSITSAVIDSPGWASLSGVRMAVTQALNVPAALPSLPLSIFLFPRIVDFTTHYAIEIRLSADPAVGNATVFRRVRGTANTVLCEVPTTLLPVATGATYAFETRLGEVSGTTANLMVLRDGVVVCQVSETSTNYIAAGTVGFAVGGSATFSTVSFGRVVVETFPRACPSGCSGVVAGGNCTLPCNPSTLARGSNVRTCLRSGNYSGTPLVCDNGAPLLLDYSASVPELSAVGTRVGVAPPPVLATGQQGSGAIVFEIRSGNWNGAFSIDTCTGQLSVASPAMLDFEAVTPNASAVYSIFIRAYVPGTSPVAESFCTVSVSVTNANDPPAITTASCAVSEAGIVGSPVCALALSDADIPVGSPVPGSFSYVFEEVPGLFALNPSTGAITLAQGGVLDFETKTSYRMMVRVADPLDARVASTATIVIRVTDAPEAPSVVPARAFVAIDQSQMVSGFRPVTNFLSACFDPDANATLTLVSAQPLTPTLLLVFNGDGSVIVAQTLAYSAVTPTIRDGFLTVDYGEVMLTVRDNTGLTGQGVFRIYVVANVTGVTGPIVRAMSVISIDSAAGTGSFPGGGGGGGSSEHLINTNGRDRVLFTGDNMLYDPSHRINATLVYQTDPRVNFSVGCAYTYTGAMTGSSPLADGILCNTGAGYGRAWSWTISIRANAGAGPLVPLIAGVALVTSYAPPIVTGIGFPGDGSGVQTYRTAGGEPVQVLGYNLGGPAAPITVELGKTDPLTGVVAWTYAVSSLVGAHDTAQGLSPQGNGASLRVRVTVGGQTVVALPGVKISYTAPTVTSIVRLTTTVWPAGAVTPVFSGCRGGDVIAVRGRNLGPAGPGVTFTFGLPAWADALLPYAATCTHVNLTAQHTEVQCVLPTANGGQHTGFVTVGGQRSARTLNVASTRLQYHTAHVSTVSGPGARAADTRGGQIVYFTGANFGPASVINSGLCAAPAAFYGQTNGTAFLSLKYRMDSCTVLDEAGTRISCLMVEGTGYTPPFWRWTIMSCGTGWTGLLATIRYAPPIVTSFDVDPVASPGAEGADTRGGQAVVVRGLNFGPTMDFVTASYYASIPGPDGVIRNVWMNATGCFKPPNDARKLPHEMMTCYTAPGAGAGLRWEVIVETQKSVALTTSYAVPSIASVSINGPGQSVVPLTAADDMGGAVVYILGTNFGPLAHVPAGSPAGTKPLPLIQWVRFGPTGGEDESTSYTPLDYALVADHTAIRVTLPPGIGRALTFQVAVADLTSAVSTATFSYADPRVVSLSVGSGSGNALPTRGGQVVRVSVTGVGLLDPTTAHELFIKGVTVPILERFPSRERVVAAAGNASLLTPAELDRSRHYLAFAVPEGAGSGITVRVRAYRIPMPTSSVSTDVAADVTANAANVLSYASPAVSSVGAELLDATNVAPITASYLPGLTTDQLRLYRYVTITGANFGPSELAARLEVAPVDSSGAVVSQSDWSATANIAAIVSWGHERITAFLRVPQAAVRIVAPAADAAYGSPLTSNELAFLDVSPSVLGISSGSVPAGGFSTAGGETVVLQAGNLASYTSLQVLIGGIQCPFIDTDGVTVVPPAQVKAVVTDPQAALQAGQGIPPKDMVFNLRVRVPPGQGSSVGIAIVRDAVNGTGPYYIRYAAPSVSNVSFLGGSGGSAPASSFTPSSPLRIPTTGATLTLSGANFGTCPVVTFGIHRGAVCEADKQSFDRLTVVSANHTALVVTLPEGIGAYPEEDTTNTGFYGFFLVAADQSFGPVPSSYELPSVTSVEALSPQLFPTSGGVLVALVGSGFGPLNATLPSVFIRVASGDLAKCFDVARSPSTPHTYLTFTLPKGMGANLDVVVVLANQTGVSPSVFSYNRPAISRVVNLDASDPAYNTSSGATPGGYRVRVDGRDFGPTVDGACVFLPSPGVPPSLLLCNDLADNLDEEQVAPRAIERTNWTDTSVYFTVPPGMGRRSVRISVGGQLSDVAAASSFAYSAPVITGLTPATATTDGGDRVTITGRNFGFGTTTTSNAKRAGPVSFGPALALPVPAGTLPPRFALAVNLSSTRCISSSIDDSVTALTLLPAVQGCYSELRGASGVVSHTDTEIVFIVPPGVGKGLNLTVSVVNPEGSVVASAPVTFSYAAPVVEKVSPRLLELVQPSVAAGLYYELPQFLTITGDNFGPPSEDGSLWTPEQRVVAVTVAGRPCTGAVRTLADNPATGGKTAQIECVAGATLPSPIGTLLTAGLQEVRARVAGQDSVADPATAKVLVAGCRRTFYAAVGEVCAACPEGAVCDGYIQSLSEETDGSLPANVAKYGPRVLANVTTSWGFNVTQCVSCHTRPRALPGFFNMRGLVNKAGESETTCDAIRKAEGRRGPVDCESIVACDPPESCLGDNVCGEGYTNSKGWPYRCSACDEGFYRSSGSCRRCPNNPELNILFFFVVAVAAIAAGWFLNQKQVNIAFLTIGLDYMQVISIFASTRVAWPQQIQDLFRILSAFNLNIEVVAPECVFKSLQYTQKWGMIMALPLAVFALLLAIHGVNVFYAVCIRGQRLRGFAGDAASPLIAMAQVLMYFLYLYITRSVFDVMTCRSSDPAEYDPRTGELITYMAGVLERCGVPGGTQATLLPAAVAGLVVYVLGYPAAIGWNLWKNRALVMEDQLIRAKRSGDDRLTNPNAYTFRRRFSRAYYQFRPDAFLWVLAILGRKFLIAISALIFNTNQNFQMAAMLLVLFLAYAAQVRFLPYMGPANFDAVLKAHAEAAAAGHLAHARLVDILARIEARGRKRSHANTFSGARQKLSLSGAARALGTFLFDYNTVESILLASALLVALAGVMFGATQGSLGSSFYRTSRDGVTSAILIVIALSLLYWLTVVAAEIYGLAADERAARLQKSWSAGKGGAKQLDGGAPGSGGARRSLSGRLSADELSAVLSAPLETQANPMLTDATTGRALGAGGITTDDIRGMTQLSDARTWVAVREAYIAQADRAAALSAEVGRLKAQISRADLEREQDAAVATPTAGGGGGGGGNGGGAGSGPASPTAAVQRKKAFGPIAAAAGDPSAASVFSGYRKTAGGGGVGGGAAGGGKGRGGGLSLSTARSFRG